MSRYKMDSNTRQRMRPWLEAKVDADNITGLKWLDKSKKIFRVPWKHGGKHDWNEEDSKIFKEWALHTGRYREGVDSPDWPTWKTRFRCALNKLPDIQELRDYSCLDGPDPYRAYKFLDKEEVAKRKADSEGSMPNRHFELTNVHAPNQATNVLPNIIEGITNSPILPSDLDDINVEPFKSDSHGGATSLQNKDQPIEDMDTSEILYTRVANGKAEVSVPFTNDVDMNHQEETNLPVRYVERGGRHPIIPVNVVNPHVIKTEPSDHEIHIKIRYCQQEVASYNVKNNFGCRLFYAGTQNEQEIDDPGLQEECYGSPNLEQLPFPPTQPSCNIKQYQHTMQLLSALDRGLILETEDGCVYATRKSRCVIFIASPMINDGDPFKLLRDNRTKVFDFNQDFYPRLQRYVNQGNIKPLPYFLIGFGQKLQTQNFSHGNLLISAIVYHTKSSHQLNQVCCSSPLSPPIHMSHSDDFDRFLQQLREVQNSQSICQSQRTSALGVVN